MRIIAFITYLCFLLITGGNYVHAATPSIQNTNLSSLSFAHKKHIKTTIEDQTIVVIEDSDVDVEDDFFAKDNAKSTDKSNFFVGKYTLVNTLYFIYSRQILVSQHENCFKIFMPFAGNPCPIYLSQKELRI